MMLYIVSFLNHERTYFRFSSTLSVEIYNDLVVLFPLVLASLYQPVYSKLMFCVH